ncbi:inorganic diphosphatase [Nocardia sp. NPDC056064]|uniref:inorganic diphosphatase n=1 Tax=Nocardia sp. NPDC056064 TaxID=3345701 RepID=UPI0035D6A7D5
MTDHRASPSTSGESRSLAMARPYLGRTVELVIDRPYGSLHPVHGFRYEANYGYIPGTRASDGEELDAYYLGPEEPLDTAHGACIAIVHRLEDDDKLIVVPAGTHLDNAQIAAAIAFQEIPGRYQILRR